MKTNLQVARVWIPLMSIRGPNYRLQIVDSRRQSASKHLPWNMFISAMAMKCLAGMPRALTAVDIHDGRRVFLDAGNNFSGILEMLAHLLEMCLHEFGMSGSKGVKWC